MTQHTETFKNMLDASGFTVLLVTLAGWLPPIAALFTIVVAAIRIYESATVQKWLGRE